MPAELEPRLIIDSLMCLGTLGIAFSCFSYAVRRRIGQRDKWQCDCGKSFQEGWWVFAAHDPKHHSKSDPLYDTPEAGSIKCKECHVRQHEQGTSLGREKDQAAIALLQQWDERTWDYRKHPEKYKK